MMNLLRRKRTRTVLCVALACYVLFLLNLTWWRNEQSVVSEPERLQRSVLSYHRQDDESKRQTLEDQEDARDRQNPDLMPWTLDKLLHQQPGGPAVVRKKLSSPDLRQFNVVVEDALPGTFFRHASQPESSSNFKDLQHGSKDTKNQTLHKITDPRSLDRLIAQKARSTYPSPDLLKGKEGAEHVNIIPKELPANTDDEPSANRDPSQDTEDNTSHSVDSNEQDPGENPKRSSAWLAPDGSPDYLNEVRKDPVLNQIRKDPESKDNVQKTYLQNRDKSQSAKLPKTVSKRSANLQVFKPSSNVSVSRSSSNFKEIADVTIYSAFYDDRLREPVVRMFALGPISRSAPLTSLWCVFAATPADPTPVSVHQTADCLKMKKYCFYMLHCQVPAKISNSSNATSSVLLVVNKHDNNHLSRSDDHVRLDVITNRKTPTSNITSQARSNQSTLFSVCVPPLFGRVGVLQLVEFIELSRVLGASYFTFYNFRVSTDVTRVLAYYEKAGLVRVLPWTLPAPNEVWDKGRSLAMGDCLFRNMHLFDYVVFQDIDQVFVPRKEPSWQGFINTIKSENVAVYAMRTVKFYPRKSPVSKALTSEEANFLTLVNSLRGQVLNVNFSRLVVKPERVLELDDHSLVKPISGMYASQKVDPHVASVHQYSLQICSPYSFEKKAAIQDCKQLSEDRTVWRYRAALVDRTRKALQMLNHPRG